MEIDRVSFQYDRQPILTSVSARIPRGKITTLIGPNGCGKTTLMHLMTKNLTPSAGSIYLEGTDLKHISLKHFSKRVAIVHQTNTAPTDLTVKRLVAYGRTPYRSFYRGLSQEDEEAVEWAMETTEIHGLQDRPIDRLSGGQKQRVFMAMALAQKTDLLFLDEPTTYLDVRYQLQILELLKRLNREYGMTIVMVLHDLNQSIWYSDEIIGMKQGRIVAQGKTGEVINPDMIQGLFDIRLKMLQSNGKSYVMAVSEEADQMLDRGGAQKTEQVQEPVQCSKRCDPGKPGMSQ